MIVNDNKVGLKASPFRLLVYICYSAAHGRIDETAQRRAICLEEKSKLQGVDSLCLSNLDAAGAALF